MRVLLLALCLLLPLSAGAQTNDTSNPIVARMAGLVEAINARDLTTIGAVYSADAALFVPGEAAILGREAILAHYAASLESGLANMQFRTMDIRSTDTLAVETGEIVAEVQGSGVVLRYMHVWEVVDGQILLTRDIYHLLGTR